MTKGISRGFNREEGPWTIHLILPIFSLKFGSLEGGPRSQEEFNLNLGQVQSS